jgi:AraC-like DNA-binding protein
LDENVDLPMLAGVAGLSVHHFARQFKQSAGVTPHVYLTQKRVERAQQMLFQTDLSLAEIAFAVGLFDQGQLARHFRHTTPSRVSVVATLETNDVLDSHTPFGTKPAHRALSCRMVATVDTLASHLGNNNAISCRR